MTDDEEEAAFLAEQVEHFNRERKDIVATITEEAMAMAETKVKIGDLFLLLAKENWHEGVLGIVASKIVETFALPTLILNIDRSKIMQKVPPDQLIKCRCLKYYQHTKS